MAQTAERVAAGPTGAAGATGAVPLAEGALGGAWRRFRRSRRGLLAGGVIAVAVLLAVAAPLVAGYDPLAGSADALRPPLTPGHPLGTDHLGRDVWAQLVYGAQVSLTETRKRPKLRGLMRSVSKTRASRSTSASRSSGPAGRITAAAWGR